MLTDSRIIAEINRAGVVIITVNIYVNAVPVAVTKINGAGSAVIAFRRRIKRESANGALGDTLHAIKQTAGGT